MMEEVNVPGQQTKSPEMSLIQRIIGVFTSPSATFQAIREKPNWIVPLIILLVISIASGMLLRSVIVQEQMTKQQEMLEKRGMSQEQIDEAMSRGEGWMRTMFYPSIILALIVITLLTSGIWLLVSNTVLGGSAKYSQLLGVVVYRGFIDTVGGLIKLPIMLSKGTMNVHFSLATFLSDDKSGTFLYKILQKVEVFNVWSIAVLCLGIAVMSRKKVSQVWPWVVGIYVLYYVVSTLLGTAFGG